MLHVDTVVVGAGQAGLATSNFLTAAGRDHVVLERGRVGERWRSGRWDSLRLLTPNWMTRLPGHVYDGNDPDGYMRASELADRLARYRAAFAAPVVEDLAVRSVRAGGRGYIVDTTAGCWTAANVVVATGWFTDPVIPPIAAAIDRDIVQLHAAGYRNPSALPDGGVLVVGASSSGVQIADELAAADRAVTIAVGRHVRVPRRYRDRDICWWLDRAGVLDDRSADVRHHGHRPSLQLVGRPTDLDLGTLVIRGVAVAGRLTAVDGRRLRLADDLAVTVADAERRLHRLLDRVDRAAAARGEPGGADRPLPMRVAPGPTNLDLRAAGIGTVVWATGLRPSFPWLHVPVLDAHGDVVHRLGVTASPGLYVVGMRWQTRRSSTFIDGVRHDARAVVDHLVRRDRRAAA